MDNTPPIRVYIENAYDENIGGFTIPLPTTREVLRPWLEAISVPDFNEKDIAIRQIMSPIPFLKQSLASFPDSEISFDELNYLAAKIRSMDEQDRNVFIAAVEAKWHNGSVRDILNITENISRYDWKPAYDAEEIGANAAAEELGIFTDAGYIIRPNQFLESYRGPQDIPPEHRVFTVPQPLMKTHSTSLPAFLTLLHATAGNHIQDAEHNIIRLARLRSAEYLLLMDGQGAHITEASHAYRQGTDAWVRWTEADLGPDTVGFAIHITEVHGFLAGRVAQVDVQARQQDILENQIVPVGIMAILPSGEEHAFTLDEWAKFNQEDKASFDDVHRVFPDEDYTKVHRHLEKLCAQDEASCKAVTGKDFLAHINRDYMESAAYYSSEHLRISPMAAKDIVARQAADVFRIGPSGMEKLSPVEAVKGGLWPDNRAFAVRPQDSPKLDRWAEHATADMFDRARRRQEPIQTQAPQR